MANTWPLRGNMEGNYTETRTECFRARARNGGGRGGKKKAGKFVGPDLLAMMSGRMGGMGPGVFGQGTPEWRRIPSSIITARPPKRIKMNTRNAGQRLIRRREPHLEHQYRRKTV